MGRRITIVDVAREAGVSVSSASVALRGESGVSEPTRQRVLAAAEQTGYRPDRRAQWLREGRPRFIGVSFELGQPFHADVVQALYRAAARRGYDLVLSGVTQQRPTVVAVESLINDHCQAFILVSPQGELDRVQHALRERVVVIVGADSSPMWADLVQSDDRAGSAAATEQLVALGHRRIAFLSAGDAVAGSDRRRGYLDAMRRHGLADSVQKIKGGPTEQAGIDAMTRLLDRAEPPTAVLAHNDPVAFGALMALRERGFSVPEQVSVVGYDNTRVAALAGVDLASVDQRPEELADAAVERVISRTLEPDLARTDVILPPELVLRRSVGARQRLSDRT